MDKFLDTIRNLEMFEGTDGISESKIENAEYALDMFFSNDYKMCLRAFGQVSARNIELTSILNVEWLDVVLVTSRARDFYCLPLGYYVIEDLHYDGVFAVQDSTGKVYIYQNGTLKKHSDSLLDYMIINSRK